MHKRLESIGFIGLVLFAAIAVIISGGRSQSSSQAPTNHRDGMSPRTVEFTYRLSVRDIPTDSQHLAVWIPVPQSNNHQSISDLRIDSSGSHTIYRDPEYGNVILRSETNGSVPKNFDLKISFLATRRPQVAGEHQADVSSKSLRRFLLPDRLIPIDGRIAEEAHRIAGDWESDMEKARAIYDHIINTVVYDKSGTGWGQGDAVYACDYRRGNCTDFHSLFIGMARANGIPARFVMGFPIPEGKAQGKVQGYHCWAEFYVDGVGWIPLDASEASKYPEKRDFFFGNLDSNRIEFSVGRDIILSARDDATSVNYFIYPHVLLDGKPYTNVEKSFQFVDRTAKVALSGL